MCGKLSANLPTAATLKLRGKGFVLQLSVSLSQQNLNAAWQSVRRWCLHFAIAKLLVEWPLGTGLRNKSGLSAHDQNSYVSQKGVPFELKFCHASLI